MNPHLSEIDTETFGFPVGRALIEDSTQVSSALDFSREHHTRLLIARCPVDATQTVHGLTSEGFLLMDTQVQYSLNLNRLGPLPQSSFRVRRARMEEAPQLAELARDSFHHSLTHYHADARLDRTRCDEVYSRWVVRSLRSADDAVWVAEESDRLLGFGVARIQDSRGEAVLAGVRPSTGRCGIYIYRALLLAGTRFVKDKGIKHAVTSTQISNLVIQRMWIRMRWEPSRAYHTFHKWFD